MLSDSQSDRIAKLILSRIGNRLPIPDLRETEPRYTARKLMPQVREALDSIDIPDLILTGDGAASPYVINLPSCEFRPDIAILYKRSRIIALEVKFLRAANRQYSLAAALGQAAVYKTRYTSVGVILLDLAPVSGDADAIHDIVTRLAFFAQIYSKSGANLVRYVRRALRCHPLRHG